MSGTAKPGEMPPARPPRHPPGCRGSGRQCGRRSHTPPPARPRCPRDVLCRAPVHLPQSSRQDPSAAQPPYPLPIVTPRSSRRFAEMLVRPPGDPVAGFVPPCYRNVDRLPAGWRRHGSGWAAGGTGVGDTPRPPAGTGCALSRDYRPSRSVPAAIRPSTWCRRQFRTGTASAMVPGDRSRASAMAVIGMAFAGFPRSGLDRVVRTQGCVRPGIQLRESLCRQVGRASPFHTVRPHRNPAATADRTNRQSHRRTGATPVTRLLRPS